MAACCERGRQVAGRLSVLMPRHLLCFAPTARRWDLAGDDSDFTVDKGWGSAWVKVVASWLCALLYIWTLVAHKVLSNRSFY